MVPEGETRLMTRSPRFACVMSTVTTVCSTRRFEVLRSKDRVMPALSLSGIASFRFVCSEEVEVIAGRLVQLVASATAAPALTRPAPKLGLNLKPAPFVRHSAFCGSVCVAERISTSCTSRQPRLGLAWSIRATTPETTGAAEEVPL